MFLQHIMIIIIIIIVIITIIIIIIIITAVVVVVVVVIAVRLIKIRVKNREETSRPKRSFRICRGRRFRDTGGRETMLTG